MKLFGMLTKAPIRRIHNVTSNGQQAMDRTKQYIDHRRYREALTLIDKIEYEYPEYFKAVSIYRGQASIGLAREMKLINEKGAFDRSAAHTTSFK